MRYENEKTNYFRNIDGYIFMKILSVTT